MAKAFKRFVGLGVPWIGLSSPASAASPSLRRNAAETSEASAAHVPTSSLAPRVSRYSCSYIVHLLPWPSTGESTTTGLFHPGVNGLRTSSDSSKKPAPSVPTRPLDLLRRVRFDGYHAERSETRRMSVDLPFHRGRARWHRHTRFGRLHSRRGSQPGRTSSRSISTSESALMTFEPLAGDAPSILFSDPLASVFEVAPSVAGAQAPLLDGALRAVPRGPQL